MNITSTRTIHFLEQIVKPISIGTNLALLQIMWAMISGRFLTSRGALHTALALAGFTRDAIQCSWTAVRHGSWSVYELIAAFHHEVEEEGSWKPRIYEGYTPFPGDVTAIWRPRLQGWKGKVFRQLAGKQMCGIGFGLLACVGEIEGERIPLIQAIVRHTSSDGSEESLKSKLLQKARTLLKTGFVFIHDAGVKLKEMQEAEIPRFVLRMAVNCTARRNYLPEYKGVGRQAEKGKIVRPLARKHKGKEIAATVADNIVTFTYQGIEIVAHSWVNLMRNDLKVAEAHQLFNIWVFHDPRYKRPLIVVTNLLDIQAETVFRLYLDRWPIEQIPLVSKSLLGCCRQFVFIPICCWRLGELSLLVGNILTWLAATGSLIPVNYWDRRPKKTAGRYRRALETADFSKITLKEARVRKKESKTAHLPKGIEAHRRVKAT